MRISSHEGLADMMYLYCAHLVLFFTNPCTTFLYKCREKFFRVCRGTDCSAPHCWVGNVHFPLPSAKNQTLTFKSLWPARKLTILPPPRDSPPAAPDRLLPSLNATFIPPSDGAVLLRGNTLNDWIICFQTTGCAIRRLTGTLGALQFALHTWQLQRSP